MNCFATAKILSTVLNTMDIKIGGPEKLEDTYSLGTMIAKVKDHHMQYDMHDVFTIIKSDLNDLMNIISTVDLNSNYSTVTEEEVVSSNKWYATMTDGDDYKTVLIIFN
jgi:hypothetical protein